VTAPLLAADVPWLLYRSFFALPSSIRGVDGQPVNALLGTVNAILALLEAQPARAVVACIGAEQAEYRVKLYPQYHAHREPMPAELAAQWQRAPELLAAFGWVLGTSEELEADDVMYSYALAEDEQGGAALLLSADRDMYAAVTERVSVVVPGKRATLQRIGPAEVRERYGVDPSQVPDFIALRGDPSDGIPGAPGVGAKTAAQLLREHGSLEALLAAAQESAAPGHAAAVVRARREGRELLRPRTAQTLRENAELLRTFKRLATLARIAVSPPPDSPTDFSGGARAARKLGMARLAERLQQRVRT
jgi:5'-3' exonuclease